MRQAERDGGRRPGLTTDERARFKQFERENVELPRANEILRPSSRRPTLTVRLQSAWRFSRNELSGKHATVQDHSERSIAILILVSDS